MPLSYFERRLKELAVRSEISNPRGFYLTVLADQMLVQIDELETKHDAMLRAIEEHADAEAILARADQFDGKV